jgi:hypothetical protein
LITGGSVDATLADLSGRLVYADFRYVRLNGVTNVPARASHEMATEIVLRTSPW